MLQLGASVVTLMGGVAVRECVVCASLWWGPALRAGGGEYVEFFFADVDSGRVGPGVVELSGVRVGLT